MIEFQTHYPDSLKKVVKSFWYMRVNDFNNFQEGIVPDGHNEIIFHLHAKMARRQGLNNAVIEEPASFVAGQTVKSYNLQLDKGAILYGIRFYPHSLATLIPESAINFANTLTSLDAFQGPYRLASCLSEAPRQTFSRLESMLVREVSKFDFTTRPYQTINHVINQLLTTRGHYRIHDLLKGTHISGKYLDQLFQRYVGINPKTFSNFLKLNHFISLHHNYPGKSLTECGLEANFYDQSHLIKTFKKITGHSPKSFFGYTNFVNNTFSEL